MEESIAKSRSIKKLQRRLIGVILLAFVFPFSCMLFLQYSVENRLETIKRTANDAYSKTNANIESAVQTTEAMFKLSALRKAEMLAEKAALIIELRRLKGVDLAGDATLMDMIRNEQIGSESQISIIDPVADRILADKYVDPNSRLSEHLLTIKRLIGDKDYLAILDDLKSNPSLAGNIGTVSAIYRPIREQADGMPAGEDAGAGSAMVESKFAIVTPIKGTPWSLSVVSLMGGLTNKIMSQVKDNLEEINHTLLAIDEESGNINHRSRIIMWSALGFGVVILFLIVGLSRRRFIRPAGELMRTADAFRKGNYKRRVDLSAMTDDMIDLAETMNHMLDDIATLIESEEDKKRLQENIIVLLDIVSKAAEGDLTTRGEVNHSVLGPLLDAFNLMLDSISKLVVQVKSSGQRVTVASGSILESAGKIASDAERQTKEVHQVTGMVQQSSRSMQRVSISADMANDEAQRANVAAKEGAHRVNETIQNMQRMRSNVQATAKTIKMLGDRSLEINAIVEMINDISARTNILSLNAAIEASKAGEQGKGFAVVADEIRKLAERTTNATKEISSFIEDIQIETNDAVLAMEEVTREVELGWKASDQAGTTLRQIQDVIGAAAEKIMEISNVSRDMVNQMDLVTERTKSILQVSRETTESIRRTSRDTRSLLKPLKSLNEVILSLRLHRKYEQQMQFEWIMPTIEELEKEEAELSQRLLEQAILASERETQPMIPAVDDDLIGDTEA